MNRADRTTAFWDSSALIPLCVQEQTSSRARTLARQYSPVVWWATPVEIRSAIARLRRAGELKDTGHKAALSRLGLLSRGWREVLPSDRLRSVAEELLTQYPLRAADSLQLAAALVWCQHKPAQRNFLSGDARLCEAADSCGFIVNRL
ncbi:MAG: type II toxin-antitoxin system VapC family toxin [Acidobacteriaceae bacterium]|nr:type II toxin-antitoxin system VapC family toxin [Acidobacteriaceae bacterium]